MAEPLFSIVSVTLNCADAAARTAESVLAQRGARYEYLVKDGGSSDGTVERLRALGARVVARPDDGVYDAMNQALPLCRGEYVVFMNGGDLFAGPDALAAAARAIERHGRPDFLYGDIRSRNRHPFLRAQEQPAEGRPVHYPGRLGRFWLFRKMICHQAWFVRRSVYEARPFDTRYRVLADNAYLLDMVLRRQLRTAHVPQIVAVFEGGGLSAQDAQGVAAERRRMLTECYSPAERALYGAAFAALRAVNRAVVYPILYPLIGSRLRGRASGL